MFDADRVCIFAADHVYKMDVEQMLAFHIQNQADITVSAYVVPSSEAHQFGCIATDGTGQITAFVEKPEIPPEIPGRPGYSFVSMGNYIFERQILEDSVLADHVDKGSSHDFGRDILPRYFKTHKLMAYDFSTNVLPGADKPYWKDVGTIKAYWDAHMDLLRQHSDLTLYNNLWPIRTVSFSDPPGFTYPAKEHSSSVDGCLRAEGSRVLGAYVHKSVLSRNCVINPGAVVEGCIIGQGVEIGENCRLRNAIIDAYNKIPPGTSIGFDKASDEKNYHADKESGIVVVSMPKIQLRKNMFPAGLYDDNDGIVL